MTSKYLFLNCDGKSSKEKEVLVSFLDSYIFNNFELIISLYEVFPVYEL